MDRNYFKYLVKSNKAMIAFVFIVNAFIYVIERFNQNYYYSSMFSNTGNIVFFYVLCFVLPVLLFNHAQNKKSADSFFALPVKRKNVVITSLVSGVLLIVLPWVFITLANAVINFRFEITPVSYGGAYGTAEVIAYGNAVVIKPIVNYVPLGGLGNILAEFVDSYSGNQGSVCR